jgi:hypothetical protein
MKRGITIENFNWEEIKEKLSKAVLLEKKIEDLTIKIKILDPLTDENPIIGNMLKTDSEIKRMLAQFANEGKSVDCDVFVNQVEKIIEVKLRDKEMWEKIYNFFNDLFFGDYLKKMVEAMIGAFGGMFGREEF